uniref:Uncharacterized protein n=1 Tax=Anopheles arabiensis TaxID=7173 RepID=A0A182I0K1_ANOAR
MQCFVHYKFQMCAATASCSSNYLKSVTLCAQVFKFQLILKHKAFIQHSG